MVHQQHHRHYLLFKLEKRFDYDEGTRRAMFAQTISLFRFLILGIINRRLLVLIGVLYLISVMLSQFIMELSVINSQSIAIGFLADFLRYSLVLLMLLMVTSNVAEDFEYRQIERILTMPIFRWQYIAAQFLVAMLTALVLVLPGLIIFGFYAGFEIAAYWTVALWLEVLLVGLIGFLAILSLEKLPVAVLVSLSVYFLSKLSGLISQMLQESVYLSDGALSSRFTEAVFSGILHLLPGLESFAESDVYFQHLALIPLLTTQLLSVSVYVLLILSVCLIDFFRKEINL